MMGHKAGDNAQVRALAEGLGWPFEIKRFVYRRSELASNLLLGPTLLGMIESQSSELAPPWPDLILTAGRRNEPICLWIQKQARDHHVRLVHIGRSWAKIERFDLIVTTPQYRLPQRSNILHNETPLFGVSEAGLATAAAQWAPRLGDLPQPYIAVLMGGNSGPFTFDPAAGERLARQASTFAKERGGTLLATTSARTPPQAIDAFESQVTAHMRLFRWSKDAAENPYLGFLALAQDIIVTGDSMSMLTEACATRKPVHIFDLGEGKYAMRPGQADKAGGRRSWRSWQRDYLRAFIFRTAMRLPPKRMTRDIRIVHQKLIEGGRAVWLGDPFPAEPPRPLDSVERAVAGVRALFDLPALAAAAESEVRAARRREA